MKKTLFLLALLILGTTTMAQQHLVGLSGGVNFSNVRKLYTGTTFKPGPLVGLDYEYNTKGVFTLSTGLWFNQSGYSSKITFTDVLGQQVKELIIKMNVNYISVPLLVGIKTRDNLFFFGNIGIAPSLLLNTKVTHKDSEVDLSQNGLLQTDFTDNYRLFDLPLQLQWGIGIKINNRLNLKTGILIQYSFIKTFESYGFMAGNHYGFTPILSLRYALGGNRSGE